MQEKIDYFNNRWMDTAQLYVLYFAQVLYEYRVDYQNMAFQGNQENENTFLEVRIW